MANPIRMRKTVEGSLNGRDSRTYEAGQVYDLPDAPMHGAPGLREVFLREGWAEEVQPVETASNASVVPEITPTDDAASREGLPQVVQDILKLSRAEIEEQARGRGVEAPETIEDTVELAKSLARAAGYSWKEGSEETFESLTPNQCQATTGSGTQCKRDAVEGSGYCAIPAHQAQGA